MVTVVSNGPAIADNWPPVVTFLFGILMFGLMAYFFYSFCLSFERAKRGNFYTVRKEDLLPPVTAAQADRVIVALQAEVDKNQTSEVVNARTANHY